MSVDEAKYICEDRSKYLCMYVYAIDTYFQKSETYTKDTDHGYTELPGND